MRNGQKAEPGRPPEGGSLAKSLAARGVRSRTRLGRQTGSGLLFLAPFILAFAIFTLWPNINSLFLSFEEYQGYGNATWIGWDNYVALLSYSSFWSMFANTIEYWLIHAAILVPISFLLAVLVSSKGIRGRKVWQAMIFLPQVMSIVAVTLVFQVLFSVQNGVVNQILGIHVPWLTNLGIAKWVVILMLVWQGLGFWFVVFVAGLSSIDPEINEAALVDGAGVVKRLVWITIPLMRNIIMFAVVIDAIHSMALYTQPNVLLGSGGAGAPIQVAPLSNLIVSNLLSGSYGQSAAAGWMLFILTIAVSTLIFGVSRLIKGGKVDD